jgi:hypothetical protein
MAPPTTLPGGSATSRRTESAVTLLPHPDSPTTPKVSPLRTVQETPSTARTMPAPVKKWVRKSSISSSGAAGWAFASLREFSTLPIPFNSDTRYSVLSLRIEGYQNTPRSVAKTGKREIIP